MPKKIDYDSSSWTRLLQLFCRLLIDGKRHFQSDLAKEFKCSPQAIIRMTDTIEGVLKFNFETGTEKRRKWYRISSKSALCLGLDFEELRYLAICQEMASNVLPSSVIERINDTIFDVSVSMLNPAYADRIRQGKKGFSLFSKGRINYAPHKETIETLMTAIEKAKVCDLKYQTSQDKPAAPHLFAPARMVSMNHALYVLGATVEEDGLKVRHYITLAVHRIKTIVATDTSYTIDFPDTDDGCFGLPWHEPRVFRIRFKKGGAANYVRERIWSDDQQIEEQPDGGIILTFTSQSEPEVVSWVNSFGGAACLILGKEMSTSSQRRNKKSD